MRRPGESPRGPAPAEPVEGLVEAAAEAFEDGRAEDALARAEEAIGVAPRSVAALHYRAAALAELGRIEDARAAYERALQAGKDDVDVVAGAADFLVNGLPEDDAAREDLEAGLALARRGTRLARKAGDPELVAELAWLEGAALNQLGRCAEALERLAAAGHEAPERVDVLLEKGFALYELCRFDEARASLRRVLAIEPDDAWAVHQLALVAEASGDASLAAELDRRARKLDPAGFRSPVEVDHDTFEQEVRLAVESLPERERRALEAIPVEVAEVPELDDLTAVDPPLSPSILGLFRGPSDGEPCLPVDGPSCRSIVVYRRNLARFARDQRELREQVRVTLLHELGHLHGESEEDLRARGLE